jgi:hypothetical protein
MMGVRAPDTCRVTFQWNKYTDCTLLHLIGYYNTDVGTVFLLTARYRLGYILYVTHFQQAVSIPNKSNFPVFCSHNTELWLVQYDYNEKCLSHEARRFLSMHGRLQKNSVAWSCVNIALFSVVISRFTKKNQSCIYKLRDHIFFSFMCKWMFGQ